MGGEMTNLKNANLKVPPLKIVLSSATSGGSDRSTSTSPSSESESLDSNLTIISTTENQQERNNSKSDQKDDPVQARFDKVSRNTAKGNGAGSVNGGSVSGGGSIGVSCSGNELKVSNSLSNATIVSGNKRLHQDHPCDGNLESTATTREQTSSSNQRITRSSQRAAQQNKSDNCNEINGDDTNLAENQDKSTSETGQRKVKRRKAEQTEVSEETNQQVQPQPVLMANICPADYQLPSQNSFELYRDIRNRPHMKMMKLNLTPPRVPHGFRDYIIYGGPYLLEGNKVGLGLSGGRIESPIKTNYGSTTTTTCMTAKMKLSSNFQRRLSSFNQRHSSYIIPKSLDAPKNLKPGSPLLELFQDQERARQRMRMQHLKERERSVLTCEQEILRAYNQVTIADNQQKLHLSACTYFYYQERYHYVDEKNNYLDSINQKDSSQSRENSDSCIADNATAGKLQANSDEGQDNVPANDTTLAIDNKFRQTNEPKSDKELENSNTEPSAIVNSDSKQLPKRRKSEHAVEKLEKISDSKNACDTNLDKKVRSSDEPVTKELESKGEKAIESNGHEDKITSNLKSVDGSATCGDDGCDGKIDTHADGALAISDFKETNRAAFLKELQEIDNKWAKIKNEMFVRHKNESDSLYAVQCLEWEWKAKEVGACDVRLSLRVDPEFVPKVTVSALDY